MDAKEAQIWLMRFRAYADVYGFSQSIMEIADPDLPAKESSAIDETTDAGKKEAKAKRAIKIAFANLTMAFTTEALMGLIYKARTQDWPNGLAWLVMKEVHKKYFPKDLVSKIELRRALNAVSMKKDVLFEQISAVENKFNTVNYQIPKEDRISTALEKAPKEYGTV
jgi:hypothetical protein